MGGCDASSAALIHGPHHPKVSGFILGNPFVHNETTHAKVVVKYYYWKRFRDKSFWQKLLRLQLNPISTARSVYSAIRMANSGSNSLNKVGNSDNLPFPLRMLYGATKFKGRVLLLMSGLSLVSKEFDELVRSSPEWQRALAGLDLTRVDFPDADQAFSTIAARDSRDCRRCRMAGRLARSGSGGIKLFAIRESYPNGNFLWTESAIRIGFCRCFWLFRLPSHRFSTRCRLTY